jgi:hypothetical protein
VLDVEASSTGAAPSDGTPAGRDAATAADAGSGPRRRADHLRVAAGVLADALAASSTSQPSGWWAGVDRALEQVLRELRAHNVEAESPEGLLSQVVADAPWLAPRVRVVEQEHDRLLVDGEALVAGWTTRTDREAARREVEELLRRVEEHRHHGTELLMDAYGVDVSAGD